MRMKNRITGPAALLLAAALLLPMAGCGKDEPEPDDGPVPGQVSIEAPPEGFVDNTEGIGDYRPEELVMAAPDTGTVIGAMDEQVYYNGAGFNARFATNLLSTSVDDGGDAYGLAMRLFWDSVEGITFGDKTYAASDLVRPRDEGFAVLGMLASDFGIDKYDPETGTLIECLGKNLSGEELRGAYSEREDFDDYTVCAYYLHAEMSGLDPRERTGALDALAAARGTDHDQNLDGTLAVLLYYTTGGEDLYYTIAASAPGYFESAEDYAANMDSKLRHDISKCRMDIDGRPVGFVNQVFILCDQDEVPDHTAEMPDGDGVGAGAGGRIEDGDGGYGKEAT